MESLENAIKILANKLPGLDIGKAASGFQLEKFRGRDDPRTLRAFLREFYLHANAVGLDDAKRCKILPLLLTGDILVVYGQLDDDTRKDWKKLTMALKEYLDNAGDLDLTRQRLARRKQGNSESVHVFSQDISDLVKRAYTKDRNFSDEMRDELALQAFLGGLRPDLKQHVMRAHPAPGTLAAAVKEASREEALQREIQRDVVSAETVNLVKELADRVDRMELDSSKQEEVNFAQDRGFRGASFTGNRGQNQRQWHNSGDGRGYGNQRGYGSSRSYNGGASGSYNGGNGNYGSGYDNRGNGYGGNYRGSSGNYRGSSGNYRGSSGSSRGSFGYSCSNGNFKGNRGGYNSSYGNNYAGQGSGYGGGGSYGNNYAGNSNGYGGQQQYGNSGGLGAGRGRRPRGRGGYSINAVMTQPLTLLSICLALFSLVGLTSAESREYQICNEARGGHLIERPKRQPCDVPATEQAITANVNIYVKRTAPVLSTAYFCYNVTEIICAKSYLGMARDVIRVSPVHSNVSKALCWDLVRTQSYQNQTLEATGEFRWETRNLARPQYPVIGSRCTSTSNLVVLRGTVGSVDGQTLISGLDHLAGCNFTDLQCTRLHGITVWESLPSSSFCPYAFSVSSTAIISHSDVLVRDMQARFSFASHPVPSSIKSCLGLAEPLFLLENQVVVHVVTEIKASTAGPKSRGQRSLRRTRIPDTHAVPTTKQPIQDDPYPRVFIIPPNWVLRIPMLRWLEEHGQSTVPTSTEAPRQFKAVPLRGRDGKDFNAYLDTASNQLHAKPPVNSLVKLVNGSVVRTVYLSDDATATPVFEQFTTPLPVQRFRVVWWRCSTTKHWTSLYYEEGSTYFEPCMDFIPPPGALLTYDDGTSEIATETSQRYDCFEPYEEPLSNNTGPFFLPPHRHSNPDWPYVKPRSVIHRQRLSEEYETEVPNILIDYFETLHEREYDHPADLPHGTVITYANMTQLYIFWLDGTFEMLRHNAFIAKQRAVNEQQTRSRRSVDSVQLLDDEKAERTRAEAVLRAFREAEEAKAAEAAEAARRASLFTSSTARRPLQYRATSFRQARVTTRRPTTTLPRRITGRRHTSAARPTHPSTKPTTTMRSVPTAITHRHPSTWRRPASHTSRTTKEPRLTTLNTLTRVPSTPLPTKAHDRFVRSTAAEESLPQQSAISADAQPPSTSQREQIVNFVNSRLQFATHQVRDETRKEYESLWKLTCSLHNRHTDIINAIMSRDATTGTRLFLQRDDVIAKHVGEVISVSACSPVIVDSIFWNQTINGRCYEHVPVRIKNVTLFIHSGSRDLLPRSRCIPCDQRNLNVYRSDNGTWSSIHGPTHVSSLTQHLMFNVDGSNLDIHAPSLFQSDLAQITSSLSMMTQYAQRINTPRTRIPVLPNDTPPALDDLLREFGGTVEGLATNATAEINTWFDTALNTVTDTFSEWQRTVYAILIGFIIIAIVAASLYTYPWWSQLIPQRHAVHAVTLHGNPASDTLVEDYYPDSDHIRFATPFDYPACMISVGINGSYTTALCDSGSNVSYVTRDFAWSLGLNIRQCAIAGRALDFGPMHFTGRAYAKLDIQTAEIDTELLIVDNRHIQPQLVLGTDTLARAELVYGSVVFNLIKGLVRFGIHQIPFVRYDMGCGVHWQTGCARSHSESSDSFAENLHVTPTSDPTREVLVTKDGSAVVMIRRAPAGSTHQATPATRPTNQREAGPTTPDDGKFPIGRHPITSIDIKDDHLRAMLDSGASFTLISENSARKLGLDFEDVTLPQARLANGELISFKHRVLLQFSINCTAVSTYAFVTSALNFAHVPVILGVDAFKSINMLADIRLSFALKTIDIGGRMSQMEDHFTTNTTPLCCQTLSVPASQIIKVRRQRVHQPYIRAKLGNRTVRALFDSGSSITFCGWTTAWKAAAIISSAHRPSALTANGTEINFIGSTHVNVQVGGCTVPMEVFVTSDEYAPAELIIGTDTMAAINEKNHTISLDWCSNTVRIGNTDVPMVNAVLLGSSDDPKVRIRTDEIIKARSEAVILAKVDYDLDPSAEYIVEETDHRYGVQVGRSFVRPGASRRLPIRLVNLTNSDVKLYRNSIVATLQRAEHVRVVFDPSQDSSGKAEDDHNPHYIPKEADWTRKQPTADRRESIRQQLRKKLDLRRCCLTPAGQQQLRGIIEKHPHVFEGTVGCFRGNVQHYIHLIPNSAPVRARAYRTPIHLTAEVERQLKELLDLEVIKTSTSPFASPIVLVRKKNGKYRFATDYRMLNKITVPQYCPMSNISEILDLIGGSKIFTTVDLQSGFWQIPVYPPHRERTAFITSFGQFEWIRMPFGLRDAPATFTRAMDELRRHMTARVYSYMDDIVLASSSEEAHLRDLDNFFEVLEQFGLTVALEKCRFAEPEVKYLGFIVSEHGFRPDPKALEAIRNFKTPKNPTEIKSFLGALGYIRSFIKGFAQIARPLYELGSEEKISEWTPEHETSFRTLIERATSAPVLAAPKLGRPFIIETDFSCKAVSAILFQADENGKIHPIRYASRVCNKHEANYPAVEGEALAIAYAVEEFRPYIEGAPTTTIRTDSSALRALMRRKDLHGRLAKYQTMIQSFDLDIVHRSGKSNLLADHLSRYPAPTANAVQDAPDSTQGTPLTLEIPGISPPTVDFHHVRSEQKLVPELRALYDAIVSNKWPEDAARRRRLEKIAPLYAVRNEMVHRLNPDDDGDLPRIEIPYVLREPLINEFHATALQGAHLGVEKTYDRMRRRVHWDGMKADIAAAVSSCSICQRRQNKPPYFTEPLHPIDPPRFPFQRLHIDILKLPRTTRGNGYVLACQDAFTKWLTTSAMPDQAAPTVAQAFIDDVLTKFGTPHTVVSDQGKQFTGIIFQEISRLFGFRHKTTTTYNPQSNGQIERQNRTLTNMLGSFAERSGKDWDRYLSLVTSAFNNSVQESTKQTPFYMNFAREMRLPLDIAMSTPPPRVHSDVSVFLDQTQAALRTAWDSASAEMVKAQEKQKRQADQHNHASERPIQPQDLVLYYRTQPPAEEAHKLRQPFTGPFRVVAVRHPNVTLRALDHDARPFTTHINKVKPYTTPQTLPLRRQRYDNVAPADGDAQLSDAESVHRAIPATITRKQRTRPVYDDAHIEQSDDETDDYECDGQDGANLPVEYDQRRQRRSSPLAREDFALAQARPERQQQVRADRRRSERRVRELQRLQERHREHMFDEGQAESVPMRRSARQQERHLQALERIRDELDRLATEH